MFNQALYFIFLSQFEELRSGVRYLIKVSVR